VFGKTLICADSEVANKVTDKYKLRIVTLRTPSPSPFKTLFALTFFILDYNFYLL
jgi:hypothetical protein